MAKPKGWYSLTSVAASSLSGGAAGCKSSREHLCRAICGSSPAQTSLLGLVDYNICSKSLLGFSIRPIVSPVSAGPAVTQDATSGLSSPRPSTNCRNLRRNSWALNLTGGLLNRVESISTDSILSKNPTVVFVDTTEALPPVKERAGGHGHPLNESPGTDLGLLRPGRTKSPTWSRRSCGHPAAG
jgi:hypothetical protein